MKRLIVSLFMSVVLILGVTAMAQSSKSVTKAPEKQKTEVKADAAKQAPCKAKKSSKKADLKATKATKAKAEKPAATTPSTPVKK